MGSLLASSAVVFALQACQNATGPKHTPIDGALGGAYYQRLFNGLTADKLPSTTQQPVVQYKGTLCLFSGGAYAYAREFWFYNTTMQKSTDTGTQYGTYEGDPAVALAFSGTVSGNGAVSGDTITVGSNQFIRFNGLASTCEALR